MWHHNLFSMTRVKKCSVTVHFVRFQLFLYIFSKVSVVSLVQKSLEAG